LLVAMAFTLGALAGGRPSFAFMKVRESTLLAPDPGRAPGSAPTPAVPSPVATGRPGGKKSYVC